ncbi:MAG: ATP-binding cassette domain-containing protein [Ruminococcus sp.]|nr:ATP-binding cassette domain-containing protein [Ruminococcus sp.]
MVKISVQDFTVKRGEFVLKPTTFEVKEGEIFAVLGQTGSGKTVLLEAISGMFRGMGGKILLEDREVCEIPAAERGIGFVYQDKALFPHMTVYENIVYGLKRHGISKMEQKERTREMMEMFSISHLAGQNTKTLSGGEGQRVALARALILKPEVLLLDEPFSALDPVTKSQLYKKIKEIHEKYGCTIVFVTHDFHEAQILADRVAILLQGELKLVTEASRLMQGTYSEEVEHFLGR